jgi:hypothetical protein
LRDLRAGPIVEAESARVWRKPHGIRAALLKNNFPAYARDWKPQSFDRKLQMWDIRPVDGRQAFVGSRNSTGAFHSIPKQFKGTVTHGTGGGSFKRLTTAA